MAVVLWKDFNIKLSDLRRIGKGLELILSDDASEAESDMLDAWDYAKRKLGNKLKVLLPNLFVNKALGNNLGLSFEQFLLSESYSDLDNVLDILYDKEDLRDVGAYMTLERMCIGGMIPLQMLGGSRGGIDLETFSKRVKEERVEVWKTVVDLLWVDLNGDEQVTDNERVRTRNVTLWRS